VRTIASVALPLLLLAGYLLVRFRSGGGASRRAVNVHTSLLLMVYLVVTAGLGVFWVARQELPVFDFHYLFGYATLLLVAVHLALNLPGALRFLGRRRARPSSGTRSAEPAAEQAARAPRRLRGRTLVLWLLCLGAIFAAFALGTRHARRELSRQWIRSPGWGAPACSRPAAPPATGAAGPVEVALRYHQISSISRSGAVAAGPRINWGSPPPPFKHYPDREQLRLGSAHQARGAGRSLSVALQGPAAGLAAARSAELLSQAELSALFYHTAGITEQRGGFALRAAPSAGGLFPSEVYLVASKRAGLEAGIYHYEPQAHALDRLRKGHPSAVELGAPESAAEGAVATVLVTSIVRRTGHRYRDRAYRYVLADAGHLLENLRVSAGELGLQTVMLDRFDEARAAQALGIDGVEEAVVAMARLRPPGPSARAAASSTQPVRGALSAPPLRFSYPEAPPEDAARALGIIGLVQRATSLRADAPSPASEHTAGVSTAVPAPSFAQALPVPRAATANALGTIAARRSERRYTDEPLLLAELGSLLYDAMSQPAVFVEGLRASLIAVRAQGLAPGVYHYEPASHGLVAGRQGDLAEQAQAVGVSQAVMGDAAAHVVFWADLPELLSRYGARGYRHLWLETGMASERVLLSAAARGMGACPIGAFWDGEAARLVGLRSEGPRVLLFVTLGPLADE